MRNNVESASREEIIIARKSIYLVTQDAILQTKLAKRLTSVQERKARRPKLLRVAGCLFMLAPERHKMNFCIHVFASFVLMCCPVNVAFGLYAICAYNSFSRTYNGYALYVLSFDQLLTALFEPFRSLQSANW